MLRILAVLALSIFILLPDPAQARRGAVYGERETLLPIAPTEIDDAEGERLTLCVLQHQYHLFFLSGYATQKYALAPNNCDSDSYYDYSKIEMSIDKVRGLIPNDIPPDPAWTVQTIGNGFSLWFAAALLGIGALLVKMVTREPVSRQEKILGKLPPDVIKMLDVMIHAAKLEGRVRKEQVALIKEMLEEFTPAEVHKKAIAKLLKGSERTLTDKAIAKIAEGTDHDTRLAFLRGAMDVLRADGKVSKNELKFMVRLGKGLGVSDEEIGTVYEEFGQVAA